MSWRRINMATGHYWFRYWLANTGSKGSNHICWTLWKMCATVYLTSLMLLVRTYSISVYIRQGMALIEVVNNDELTKLTSLRAREVPQLEMRDRCENVNYRQTSNISRIKSQNLNVSRLVLQLSLLIHWSQMLSQEWRCSLSSADRRCSNYIRVISKFIAY